MGIVDNTGSLVVEYKYDAWGKPVITQTLSDSYEALAELNPFKHRGYAFDEETGLYYLRSRYYNPEIARFTNADRYVSNELNVLGKNSYAYCFNCPTMLEESTGAWPKWLKVVAAAVTVVAVTAVCVATAGAAVAAVVSAHGVMTAAGAVTVGMVKTATAVGGLIAGGAQVAIDAMDGDDDIDISGVAIETISGCAYGMVNGMTGGSNPVLAGKWVGAIGRSAVGAASALARGINNGDSMGEIAINAVEGACIPLIMNSMIRVKESVRALFNKSADSGRGYLGKLANFIKENFVNDPATKTAVIKVGGPLYNAIIDAFS